MRQVVLVAAVAAALVVAVGAGFGSRAQEAASPAASPGSEQILCATPLAQASGDATPTTTITAPEAAASPGGTDPGTPVGLFPCGTPNPTATPATPTG